jgi:hypothetical protein
MVYGFVLCVAPLQYESCPQLQNLCGPLCFLCGIIRNSNMKLANCVMNLRIARNQKPETINHKLKTIFEFLN